MMLYRCGKSGGSFRSSESTSRYVLVRRLLLRIWSVQSFDCAVVHDDLVRAIAHSARPSRRAGVG
jgi:hypothetical protein